VVYAKRRKALPSQNAARRFPHKTPQGASLTKRRKALLKGTTIITALINYINNQN
jgi:hypothetical protein